MVCVGQCFRILPPVDRGVKSFAIILFELMGVFAGTFVAALTFIVMRRADLWDLTHDDALTALKN